MHLIVFVVFKIFSYTAKNIGTKGVKKVASVQASLWYEFVIWHCVYMKGQFYGHHMSIMWPSWIEWWNYMHTLPVPVFHKSDFIL